MEVKVRRFEPSNEKDFYRLHEAVGGACFCVAWWVPTWDEWLQTSAEDNRRRRESLLKQGEYDGYLLYVDGEPVGWCQAGRRDRLDKLVHQFELRPEPEVWAITCFHIAPTHRRRGLAARLLEAVLRDLRTRGVERVQVFPKRGPGLDEMDLWNGPESMYRKAGFEVLLDDESRPILEIKL